MQQNISILLRFQGCLMGVRIGDAMGAPWETKTPEAILRATDGKGVRGFEGGFQDAKWEDMWSLQLGDATDDWQLTVAVARSLIRNKGFITADCAREHADEMRKSTIGWGGTTRKSK